MIVLSQTLSCSLADKKGLGLGTFIICSVNQCRFYVVYFYYIRHSQGVFVLHFADCIRNDGKYNMDMLHNNQARCLVSTFLYKLVVTRF